MRIRSILLSVVAAVVTAGIAANAQVPGVNSTLNTVFTLAYDRSTMKQTFSATIAGVTIPSVAEDLCSLSGSATKNVRVRRVIVSGASSTAQTDPVSIVKRSSATTTTGVSVILADVPYDSSNSAGTAVAEYYTTSPSYASLGTLVGVVMDLPLQFRTTTGLANSLTFTFGELGQPVVLRGAAQQIAVNFSSLTFLSGVYSCTFEWTEE